MKNTFIKSIFNILIFLIIGSCKTYSDDDKKIIETKIENYIKKSTIKYQKSESGLYYIIEHQGEGEFIKITDEVSFNYVGRFLNGEIFDGQFKSKAITFEVTKLIEGWKEAMLYLKKGGKAKLIVPPYLGYGDYDLEEIPKNSILLFDISILDVK
jgi:FKBP-type peptidyl-prolyl cis-trans isomerase FkpA